MEGGRERTPPAPLDLSLRGGAAGCRTSGSGAEPSAQAVLGFRRCGFQPRRGRWGATGHAPLREGGFAVMEGMSMPGRRQAAGAATGGVLRGAVAASAAPHRQQAGQALCGWTLRKHASTATRSTPPAALSIRSEAAIQEPSSAGRHPPLGGGRMLTHAPFHPIPFRKAASLAHPLRGGATGSRTSQEGGGGFPRHGFAFSPCAFLALGGRAKFLHSWENR